MGVVGRVQGQILGMAKGTTTGPLTLVTVTSNLPGASQNPGKYVLLSPSCLAQYEVGDSLTLYVAYDPADIAAIEGAISAVDLCGSV
jgi:hypothetical protein